MILYNAHFKVILKVYTEFYMVF